MNREKKFQFHTLLFGHIVNLIETKKKETGFFEKKKPVSQKNHFAKSKAPDMDMPIL